MLSQWLRGFARRTAYSRSIASAAALAPRGSTSYVKGWTEPPLLSCTVGELLAHTANTHGDRDGLVVLHQHVHWSYRELLARVDALAATLLQTGLRPGDPVGICAANCAEWILIQYATSQAGLVLVNINPAYRPREMLHAINAIGCRALFMHRRFRTNDFIAMMAELAPELRHHRPGATGALQLEKLPTLQAIYLLDGDEDVPGLQSFRDLTGNADASVLRGLKLDIDDVVNVQFTSGTTGLPKGASLTHRNLVNNGYMIGWTLRYTAADRVCICVPMYHCFGMVIGSLAAVAHGAASVMPNDWFDPARTLHAVERERCTSILGVPTMFIAELALPDFASYNLTSLRTGVMAGSLCPPELMKKVVNVMHVREMTVCYGMTETAPVSFQSHVDDPFDKRVGSVGRIHPHVEVCIVDPDTGKQVPVGQPGELLTRGYSVMKGYWGDAKRTREAIDADGWMHTGDMATLDEHGYCRIVGRYKDLVIRGGENVYPSEVEDVLYAHPAVRDVQVVGVPDEKFGEELCACIIPHDGMAAPTTLELQQFCKGKLAPFKIPRYALTRAAYPMTVTGKIQKFLLRDEAARELGLGPR
eukprot:m.30557 g.30557  ORF g.30557 m.30557 type:complete len:588 (+) comp4789_c0_seq2:26-1789(+)